MKRWVRGPIGTATMSFSSRSSYRTPASKPAASTSMKLSSATTSRVTPGLAFRNGPTILGSTTRATMLGTFSRRVPVGLSRK